MSLYQKYYHTDPLQSHEPTHVRVHTVTNTEIFGFLESMIKNHNNGTTSNHTGSHLNFKKIMLPFLAQYIIIEVFMMLTKIIVVLEVRLISNLN